MNTKKYLDYEGLETLTSIIKNTYAEINDLQSVEAVATNAAEAITALGASKQDVLVAGSNIQIASDGKTISATDTTYNEATTSTAGLMSAADKTKLNSIDNNADVNIIEKVKVNGSILTPDENKAINIKVPTKTSDLTNNSNFVSDASYVHIDVDSALSESSSNPVENQAIHTALAGKLDTTLKGANSGLAELDANGKVPTSQLPSFVDDVVEADNYDLLPVEGETGKIYVTLDNNKTYRWSGSAYVEISESLALGTTSSTAFRGDYGQTAYTHATDSGKLTTATAAGMYKVGATAEGHISALTAITAADIEGILSFASNSEIDSLFGIAN